LIGGTVVVGKQNLRILFLVFLYSISLNIHAITYASEDITTSVYDEDGIIIDYARVIALDDLLIISELENIEGIFNVLPEYQNNTFLIIADKAETLGYDYLPREVNFSYLISGPQLKVAYSVRIENSIQFVDTENLPTQNIYTLTDSAGNKLEDDYQIPTTLKSEGVSQILNFSSNHLIIPVIDELVVQVNSTVLIGSDLLVRTICVTKPESVSQGDSVNLDIRRFSIPYSIELTQKEKETTKFRVKELESLGFYLSKQDAEYNEASKNLDEAQKLYEEGSYKEAFNLLKRSYITFHHTLNQLNIMYLDASVSIRVLIIFFAVVSITASFLLTEKLQDRVIVSLIFYFLCLILVYEFYPGSRILPLNEFILVASTSLGSLGLLSFLIPKRLTGRGGNGHVPVRNIILPTLNIAKRSLVRRQLRFILTLVSLVVLVLSFVTLTSFSEGYGVSSQKIDSRSDAEGVLIRSGKWTRSEPFFLDIESPEIVWLSQQLEVKTMSWKAQNLPLKEPLIKVGDVDIHGIIGIDSNENELVPLVNALSRGKLPDDGGVMISSVLAEELGVEIGGTILLGNSPLIIQGIFDDTKVRRLMDLDRRNYLPDRWVNNAPEGEAPIFILETCLPEQVVFTSVNTALSFQATGIVRTGILLQDNVDLQVFAERMALQRGFLTWGSSLEEVRMYRLGNYFEGKGLSITIPWIIVVLNVVITMLNSMYERRGEISILSSVGLNPAQISAIFVAEATVTAFLAGGIGYLAGLGVYRLMADLSLGVQVHQKVSAVWSLAAIGLSIFAVLTGAFAALRSSVVITPSLMRRWRITHEKKSLNEPIEVVIPLKLESGEVEGFTEFMYKRLEGIRDHPIRNTSSIKLTRKADQTHIKFVYKSAQATTGNFYTTNILTVKPDDNETFTVVLSSLGNPEWIHDLGTLIRMYVIEYSALD
jgi:hypothetical protein